MTVGSNSCVRKERSRSEPFFILPALVSGAQTMNLLLEHILRDLNLSL